MNKIGQRIEEIRTSRSETQQQVADALGVKRETIYQWEAGTRHIKDDNIIDLAQHFNVSADWLLGLSDTQSPDADVQQVCKYTGLSEEAVHQLHRLDQPYMESLEGLGKSDIDLINEFFHYGIFSVTYNIRLAKDYAKSTKEAIENAHQNIEAIVNSYWYIDYDNESIGLEDIDKEFSEYRRWRFEAIDNFTRIIDNILLHQGMSDFFTKSRSQISSIIINSLRNQTENQNEQDTSPKAERSAQNGND